MCLLKSFRQTTQFLISLSTQQYLHVGALQYTSRGMQQYPIPATRQYPFGVPRNTHLFKPNNTHWLASNNSFVAHWWVPSDARSSVGTLTPLLCCHISYLSLATLIKLMTSLEHI